MLFKTQIRVKLTYATDISSSSSISFQVIHPLYELAEVSGFDLFTFNLYPSHDISDKR